MKRISILLSSLCVVAAVGACAPTAQVPTRAETAPLSFQPGPPLSAVEDQVVVLNRMADQLVYRSTVQGATNGAIISCGVAALFGGTRPCAAGAAGGAATGGLLGRVRGQRGMDERVELVSAEALVRSIRGMNGQMDTLEFSLPDLLARQDAELADLAMRRDIGALSQAEYDQGVFAIGESRARIAHALTLTEEQAKQANYNMQIAGAQGQDGLDWHLSATAQLAREANSARSLISPLEMPFPTPEAVALPQDQVVPLLDQPVPLEVHQVEVPPASLEVWTAPIDTAMAPIDTMVIPVTSALVDVPRPGVLR